MSNKQFSLTIKAIDIIEDVPKRSRSKFVSDAIVNYVKKKDIMDNYLVKKHNSNLLNLHNSTNSVEENINKNIIQDNDNEINMKPKIKIDEDF